MGKAAPLELDDHSKSFIEAQIAQGRYRDETEVMHAGLRLLEEQETRLADLRSALIEGEQSGRTSPFDFDAFIRDKRNG